MKHSKVHKLSQTV